MVEIWDPEKKMWISKQDVSITSFTESEKGQASDSFKRACFNIGIGRELYTAPSFIWISADKVKIQPKGDKYITYDSFRAKEISYNDQREIYRLVIVNDRGMVVYEMENGNAAGQSNGWAGLITELQRKQLMDELTRTGIELSEVLDRYGVAVLEQLSPDFYAKAMAGLKRTKSRIAA